MIGLGTLVNASSIIVGGFAGLFLRKGLPDRYKSIVIQSTGLATMMIGLSGVFQGMFKVVENGKIDRLYIMTMIFSLIVGGIIGEFIDIEDKLERVGKWLQKKFSSESSNFSEGFVSASLIFCVGAMAIVGALEDGLTGNANTLFAKSILDGVFTIVFTSTMGIGVIFSSIAVFVYQGSITLLAVWIKPWLTDIVISQMSLVGSVLIFCIGLNVLEIKKIKVGNLLPAIFIPLIYYIISRLFS